MLGPDGIPHGAWRALGSVGIDILYGVACELADAGGIEAMTEAYLAQGGADCEHNLSTLCCLPKKPIGSDPLLGDYYRAGDTRPLSIVNCDNRLVANSGMAPWPRMELFSKIDDFEVLDSVGP